jgi:hypothetical protein
MPNESRLMDASPVLRYKSPEGWARFDQRANESFSIRMSVRSNPVDSSDEMRISGLTERALTARTLRSCFPGDRDTLSSKYEFFAKFGSNQSDTDGQTRLAIVATSVGEKAEEFWF